MSDFRREFYWPRPGQLIRACTSLGGLLKVAGALVLQFASIDAAFAQTPDVDPDAPLARCKVKVVSGAAQQPSMEPTRRRAVAAKPLADYQRGTGIDWRVPKNVNADDPSIRCLLMCPGGPLVIDLQVLIDGEPFRKKREKAIDEARSTAVTAQDKPAETESNGDKDTEKPSDGKPPALTKLARYIENQQDPVDQNQARWLLAQWTPGPSLLVLRDGFAAERALIAPVWNAIDQDDNGELSEDEYASAEQRLRSVDIDRDGVIDSTELRRVSAEAGKTSTWHKKRMVQTPRQLLVPIGDFTDWDELYWDASEYYSKDGKLIAGQSDASQTLIQRLDTNENNEWDADETARLQQIESDLTLKVTLGAGDESETGLSVQQLAAHFGSPTNVLNATADAVTVDLAQCYLELSAAQPAVNSKTHFDQIAIGAVMDGYPLMRLLDQNNDRRLSIRECKSIATCLDSLDDDQDGKLTEGELGLPVRMSVTLGPHVQTTLREPAPPAIPPFQSDEEQMAAPAWFARMESNNDGDLSSDEFIGTREQLEELDQDSDGLLSVKEVQQIDATEE